MRIEEVRSNGLSLKGEGLLRQAIGNHKPIFEIRLGGVGPALVTPIKITVDPHKKPVKVKVRKYPADQRKLFDAYLNKLVKLGFLKFARTHCGKQSYT